LVNITVMRNIFITSLTPQDKTGADIMAKSGGGPGWTMGVAILPASVPGSTAKLGTAKGSATPKVSRRVLIIQFVVGLSAQPTMVR